MATFCMCFTSLGPISNGCPSSTLSDASAKLYSVLPFNTSTPLVFAHQCTLDGTLLHCLGSHQQWSAPSAKWHSRVVAGLHRAAQLGSVRKMAASTLAWSPCRHAHGMQARACRQWCASACTPSTSIASGAAASGAGAAAAGLAAHAFCAAGCAGALLKKPNMLCWPCLALLPACHSLLHFSACSSLLILMLNSLLQPTTGHFRSSIMTFQTECYPQSSSRHNSSTAPPDTSKRLPINSCFEPRIQNI